MTREEAIKILSTRDMHGMLCGWTNGYVEALDMAIEALSQSTTDDDLTKKTNRYEVLLKATCDLLKKQYESLYILNLLSEPIFYDGVECDGWCLMEDIENELELWGTEDE